MARNFVKASSQWIDVAGLPDFTQKLTIALWARPASQVSAGQFHTLFSKNKNGGDRNFGFDWRVTGGTQHIDFYWTSAINAFVEYQYPMGMSNGTLHHLAWTIDWTTNPDSVAGYSDGVSQGLAQSGSNNATPTTNAPQLAAIGAGVEGGGLTSGHWDGEIAEVALWDVVLNAAEIAALAKAYAPLVVHPSNLVFYAPLIRDLFDYKGNATLTDHSTTVVPHCRMIYPG